MGQPHERRVQSALIEYQRVFADLLEPSGRRVGMLRPHCCTRAQHDEVERALQKLYAERVIG